MSETKFTADQLDAIDVSKRHRNACVVAGPGSGKTTVLVEYFRRLVAEGVDPLRVLAITFTEKAASNMRKKLGEAFRDDSEIRAKLERAWVSTVHGFCARLLRENAIFAGVDPEFKVSDERESVRLQKESIDGAMEEAFANDREAVRRLVRGLSSFDFEDAVLSVYDAIRGAGMTLEQVAAMPEPGGHTVGGLSWLIAALRHDPKSNWSYPQKQHLDEALESAQRMVDAPSPLDALREIEVFPLKLPKCKKSTAAYDLAMQLRDYVKEFKYALIARYFAPERALLFDILRGFDRAYRDRKRQAGLLDFSDLEEYTVRLLETNLDARARVQAQFEHVLMDEFQDTNGQQAKLLQYVRPPDRFYAVGDINQSIFGFRHAEPQGFAKYRDEIEQSGGHLVHLADNFRSRSQILSAVETIAHGRAGIEPRKLTAGRTFDTDRTLSVEVLGINAEPADAALEIEAKWVARRILELLAESPEFCFEDVAVLVRNTEVLSEFAAAFDEANIPYVINRGRGFYDTREVTDLTHLLRVIANPRDEVSLAAVLRSPLVQVSDEALIGLRILVKDNIGGALWRVTPDTAADFNPADYLKLAHFRERLNEWRIRREYVTFDRLLHAAMDECGYQPESGSRGAANIDKFLAQARDAASRMSLDQFVEELAIVRKHNPREPDAPPEDSANAVKVMTVHSAKGLEFPIVFVSAIHKGIDSNLPVVAFSPRIGLGARWRNPAIREDKNDLYQHAIREERKKREQEESERLLYVAMTRAEQHLALTFSGKKLKEWAEIVTAALQLDPSVPHDETVVRVAPDGATWNLRVLMTDRAPELLRNEMAPGTEPVTAQLLDAPTTTGQYDANATVTALAKFAKCPREYYLGTYLGFEGGRRKLDDLGDANDELPASEFGSQVHVLLAGLMVPEPHPEALRLAEVFHKGPLGKRLERATRVEREFDFLMSVDDLVIRGQVDLWFEEGGQIGIVDYKTDKLSAVEAHQRARDYEIQLRIYAMAIERVAGRAVDRAWLHFLRPNTVIEVDLTPSLLESPEQLIRDFQAAQAKLEFPLNEAEHCRRCQFYRDLCPATYQISKEANAAGL